LILSKPTSFSGMRFLSKNAFLSTSTGVVSTPELYSRVDFLILREDTTYLDPVPIIGSVAELEALACDIGALPYGREECVLLLELILILDGHRSYLDLYGSIIRAEKYTYIFDKLRDPLPVLLAQGVSFLYRDKSFMLGVLSFSACSLRASGE
jgi:hypothetical protein